jgi:hypothetical protein
MLQGDTHASTCIVDRNGEVALEPYCDKTIKPRLPSTEQEWRELQDLLALNAVEETALTKPSDAWDMDDAWHNPDGSLPDPAPNILNIRSPRSSEDGKRTATCHLLHQMHPFWTLRTPAYGESPPFGDLTTSLDYFNCLWHVVNDPWGEKKISFAYIGWSPSTLTSIMKDRKNPFTEANLAKLWSFCTAPKFKWIVEDHHLICLLLVYKFGVIFGKDTYVYLYIYILGKGNSYLLEDRIQKCSIKLSRGVTGFLPVFLHVYEGVGNKIQPTRYKTKRTHRRASFKPQEGLADQNRPQNHQIDRNYRSLDILTVFVPVGYFPCCCRPLVIVTIN